MDKPTADGPDLDEVIAAQIDALALEADRPLVVCDCDEVLLQFLRGLERFLENEGCRLQLDSFRLHGNIKYAESGATVDNDTVTNLLKAFYARSSHDLEPVEGAAPALTLLADEAQIVVLTNVTPEAKPMRVANLESAGMTYPVVANAGLKGPAVAALAARAGRPVFFIDDIPHNLDSVRMAVPDCLCIHFVADPRLDRLIDAPASSDFRARDWSQIRAFIRSHLEA